jgi:menaquinone-dependent protoporphyrinogen IX oxidase
VVSQRRHHHSQLTPMVCVRFSGKITYEEFQSLNTNGIDGIMHVTGLTHPKHRHRYSEQTWIDQIKNRHDPVLNSLQER